MRRSRMFIKDPVNESLSKFDMKFENNMNQLKKMQDKLNSLELIKADLEKERLVLKKDKDFLEKDNQILRKEKDFLNKMYKNCQQDLIRLKDNTTENIKSKETKFQKIIDDLQEKLTQKNKAIDSCNIAQFATSNTYQPMESVINISKTFSAGSVTDMQKRKADLLEKNLNRVMKEKKNLQQEVDRLKTELDEMKTKITELEKYINNVHSSQTEELNLDSNKLNTKFVSTKQLLSMAEISKIDDNLYIDKNVQTDDLVLKIDHTTCEKKYKQAEATIDHLTEKLEQMVAKELEFQNVIDDLNTKLQIQRKITRH